MTSRPGWVAAGHRQTFQASCCGRRAGMGRFRARGYVRPGHRLLEGVTKVVAMLGVAERDGYHGNTLSTHWWPLCSKTESHRVGTATRGPAALPGPQTNCACGALSTPRPSGPALAQRGGASNTHRGGWTPSLVLGARCTLSRGSKPWPPCWALNRGRAFRGEGGAPGQQGGHGEATRPL